MAFRKVDGVFWTDPKVRDLSETARYLFLYCITCPSAHSSGLYYNPFPMICYETGIKEKELSKAIGSLHEAQMVTCGSLSGVVFVRNMLKFQQPNVNEKKHIEKHLHTIQDKELLSMFLNTYPEYAEGFDKAYLTLAEGLGKVIRTKTETERDTKTETDTKENQKIKPKLLHFGISGKVKMEQKNHDKLVSLYGLKLVTDKIEAFEASDHITKKKDHYLTINLWCKKDFDDSGKGKTKSMVWDKELGKRVLR